ncbi:hypothetical protein UA18_01354 [Burkholderia multivorans]|uniref:Uncharacterized protein n=1 Tax=Burkholderia multivorans TaxID=87883 RepID=A0ABD7LGV0_9BURK|nr:hypothetical protein [Burkholderia multivorans]MDR8806080.1 hypothetical protein [Burkholderia multivorans]MDR8921270.1 hypothetical protein [Burkholderia multivorans]MDR8926906.1 hypothetical protein [Burkholderia multivorans]MDR8969498.1 hypothetical protein [Burkholderia multivorans]
MTLYLERDLERIRSSWCELDVDFEAAVLNSALHDNLHYIGVSLT